MLDLMELRFLVLVSRARTTRPPRGLLSVREPLYGPAESCARPRRRRAPRARATLPRLDLGLPICIAAARRARSAAPCKGSLSTPIAMMEREWQEESLEAGEVALEAEAPAAERPSMLSRLASWRAPAAEAQTVDVHAPQGPLGLVFERSSTVLSRIKDSSPLLNKVQVGWTLVVVDGQDVRRMDG